MMEHILPADPKANYLAHKLEIDEAVHSVLDSGRYVLADQVTSFEQEFAAYLGASHSIGVGSGTEALVVALLACGIKPGDVVVTVSHTAVATVAAIELVGARPLLLDIDAETYTVCLDQLESALKKANHEIGRVRAVLPVHIYGHPAPMREIAEMCEKYGISIIEDCAQAHGASIGGRKVGTWGDAAAFSFYPTKNLGAIGDGGALVTNNASVAENARLVREYGWRERYISHMTGLNSRLDEMQAAILRIKLAYLTEENARRQVIAQTYSKALRGVQAELPRTRDSSAHVYHQYVIRTPRRDDLRAYLGQCAVGTLIHYPVPIHLQPAYRNRLHLGGGLSTTEQICREIVSLPMHPQLTDEQVSHVCESIRTWASRPG